MGTTVDGFLLPGAAALSEFQGYDGDCGQTARLAALHVIRGVPLTAAELNALVRADIADHRASANGAEPLSAIAADLRGDGVACDSFPYHEPFTTNWHQVLLDTFHATGGRRPGPIILELAAGGALPGDERGVHYHFICVLGICAAGYYVADGDNPAAKAGKLVIYSYAQLAAAKPCGMLACQMPPPPPKAAPTPPPSSGDAQDVVALQTQIATLKSQLTTLQVQLQAQAPNLALVGALRAALGLAEGAK